MQAQLNPGTATSDSSSPQKTFKPTWRVVLGRAAWSRYTYERPEGGDLKLLGSVSKGLQVGALAMTDAGEYVQVVGDHLTQLKTRDIAKAVANAPKEFSPRFSRGDSRESLWKETRKDTPPPVVIVKKRRLVPVPAG